VKNTRISKFKYATAPLALGLALISTPSFAQDEAAEEEAGEAIIVTGSRIARPNIEAASPVTVVGAEQVALTGTTTVETLLNELPQVVPGNTRVSNNSGGENFSTIDLRGLGPGRTLILLNGERLPASTTTGVTDVSQIPTGLIERIDVVTGGASAVYGSDAIAGVVNFILKKDFEGVELVGQTSLSEDGTGFGFNVSGLVGGNFADGKGNLTVYGSFTDRSSVSQSRYDYSRVSQAIYYDNASGNPYVADHPDERLSTTGFTLSSGGSATNPYGTILPSSLGAAQFSGLAGVLPLTFGAADTDCNPATAGVTVNNAASISFNDAGAVAPSFTGTRCAVADRSFGSSRYNFAPQNYLITPYDRLTLTAIGRYDFDDKTRLNVYTSFTNANQQVNLAPTPATGIVVPVNSPLIPADLAAALATRTFVNRLTTGVVTGSAGNDVSYFTGRFANANSCRDVDGDGVLDLAAAACSAPISAANEPFVINRRFSETGPRDGRFKTNAVNVRAIIEHDLNDDWQVNVIGSFGRVDNALRGIGNINRTAVAQGLLGCPAGSLPGCVPIDIFGGNTLTPAMLNFVRIDTQQTESFEQSRVAANLTGSLGELPGGPIGIAVGAEYRKDTGESVVDDAQRTGDIYGFNAVQSIAGSINVKEVYGEVRLPILDMLSIGAGARYSDYSTVGGLFNWKAEAELTPVDFLKIRASYNRAARAPNVFELLQNGDQGFPAAVDPCNDTLARTAAILARCQAAAPAANFFGFNQSNSQVQAFAFGNPNLGEERAETWTAGAVLNFDNFIGGSLTATADYYHIKLMDRVASLGASFWLSQCYSAGDPAACARIERDAGSGQIVSVDTTVDNADSAFITSGVDFGLDWSTDLLGGRVSVSNVFTYVDKYNIGGTEYSDTVFSGIGGVITKYANTLTTAFRKDGITAQVRYVWKKGARQNFPGAELEGFFADGNSARIPDLHLVNLSLRAQVSDKFEITGIVNNLLNKYPPQTLTGTFEQANTNISFYDAYALGRNYTIQARIKF
jgi:outer membrane receptor protein involved in Fe transport